jgi:YhgE/Pip-like protein
MTESGEQNISRQVRVGDVVTKRPVWALPLVAGSILVMLMTLIYFGSIVDPGSHLRGLPVAVVNEDAGASTASGRVDVGQQVVAGLTGSHAVTSRLALEQTTLARGEARMNKGAVYATLLIPSGFTASVLAVGGAPVSASQSASLPAVELLTNSRAGTLGVSLATGVIQPAIAGISNQIGQQLLKSTGSGSPSGTDPALTALRTDPVSLSVVPFRPVGSHSGLGLSAFYISLLTMMCGFLGATIVNTSVDAYLGYAVSEVGPRWKQRLPQPITRWHTLLAKWIVALGVIPVLTALLFAVAAGILRMDAPHLWYLWLFASFAAVVIAIGTLVFFAALGTLGQLLALIVFVYLALASSGGTVPLQALSGFYRFVANFEPLRQILDGIRAILYFNAAADAGLARGLTLTAIGLVFWVAVGAAVTKWYDHRGLHRMQPELLEYVQRSAQAYQPRADGPPPVENPPPV